VVAGKSAAVRVTVSSGCVSPEVIQGVDQDSVNVGIALDS
jgi:hypothetical protein